MRFWAADEFQLFKSLLFDIHELVTLQQPLMDWLISAHLHSSQDLLVDKEINVSSKPAE